MTDREACQKNVGGGFVCTVGNQRSEHVSIGKKGKPLPAKVKVEISGVHITVTGPAGSSSSATCIHWSP